MDTHAIAIESMSSGFQSISSVVVFLVKYDMRRCPHRLQVE